jgi:4-hydroxy-tetrahydrodipicolinate synthase
MFRGSYTALITPFRDGQLDHAAFEALVEGQIGAGTHGLVPCGTTGEAPTLNLDEHKWLVETVVRLCAGKIPVLAGCSSNATAKTVKLAQHAAKVGADGILVVTPYYNRPTPEGLYQHFKAVHDAAGLPLVAYNIPGRSAVDLDLETMVRLREDCAQFVGLKDATGDLSRVAGQRQALGAGFCQLSGEDASAVEFNALGGQGCVSVTANIAPALVAEMQTASLAGEEERALKIGQRLLPLHKALLAESSPGPVKFAAGLMGLAENELRLPLVPVGPATEALVRAALDTLGLAAGEIAGS